MNPIPTEILAKGLHYATYRSQIKRNSEVFDDVYANPTFEDDDLSFLSHLPPLTLVAIVEDWCPDAFHTLPTWARLVEALPGWRLAIFPRDEHLDLMATFLDGDQEGLIPVYAFYDQRNYLQTWWSGRVRHADDALSAIFRGRRYADLDADTADRVQRFFDEGYRARYRRENLDEILTLLSAFFHVAR